MKRSLFSKCMMLLPVAAFLQITRGIVSQYSRTPFIYVITPTVSRLEQKADLTRLSNTLRLIRSLHWIVIEDAEIKTPLVTNFLANCRISYTHLNSVISMLEQQNESRHRGVMQRNAGLDWIRQLELHSGVVYFADDDNAYDIRIFEEMRYTKGVSIWPVGLAGGLKYETPLVKNGKVTGFRSFPKGRAFATDMAGFAVSVKLLNDKPSVKFRMSANGGFLEDDFLKQLGISLNDLEPKADECSKTLGSFRPPLFTMGDNFRGFPAFLCNQFAGNAREQLLCGLVHAKLFTREEIEKTVEFVYSFKAN